MALMESYKKWVRKNREYVHSLESLANGMTWLLPERFSESEIGPEAVTTVLGVLTAINQHIIDTASNRGTLVSEKILSPLPLCISMLKEVENLVEVVAQHFFGETNKWNFIAITEAAKAFVRLALLRDSGYKILLQGGETVNENEVESTVKSSMLNQGGHHQMNQFRDYRGVYTQTPEGRALYALSRFGENAKMVSDPMWFNRVHHHHPNIGSTVPVIEKPSLLSIWSKKGIYGSLFITGEVLNIIRPLVYVMFIRKYGVRSWVPWLVSLSVDLTGFGILSYAMKQNRDGKENMVSLSSAEKDEIKRRKLLWTLYIMREPFFSKYARHRLENTGKLLAPVPLVGFLTDKVIELIVGAQSRYTYTSAS